MKQNLKKQRGNTPKKKQSSMNVQQASATHRKATFHRQAKAGRKNSSTQHTPCSISQPKKPNSTGTPCSSAAQHSKNPRKNWPDPLARPGRRSSRQWRTPSLTNYSPVPRQSAEAAPTTAAPSKYIHLASQHLSG